MLIFRPLPKTLDEEAVRRALKPEKDVDGITDGSLAGCLPGAGRALPRVRLRLHGDPRPLRDRAQRQEGGGNRPQPCCGETRGNNANGQAATVTVCHTRTVDMPSVTKNAEVLIVAAGKAGAVDGSFLSPGQIVIDVGINVNEEGKLCGDVKFEEAEGLVQQ